MHLLIAGESVGLQDVGHCHTCLFSPRAMIDHSRVIKRKELKHKSRSFWKGISESKSSEVVSRLKRSAHGLIVPNAFVNKEDILLQYLRYNRFGNYFWR